MKLKLALLCLIPALAHAQQPVSGNKEASRPGPPLRLLALGDPPPFRQEIRGNQRVEVDPEKGSAPPAQVVVDGEPAAALSLGRISKLEHVPPVEGITLKDKGGNSVWSTLAVPEALRAKPKFAVFWRDPGKTWDNPHALLLPDGADVFPSGQIRFMNLLPTTSAIKVGEEVHELAAGQVWCMAAPTREETLLISFKSSDGSWLPVHNASLEPAAAGTRVQVLIFRSDTATARRPAKALVLAEQVQAEPEPNAMAATGH